MIALIILMIVIFIVVGFLLDALILNWVAKKFKIANVVYKKTLLISVLQRVISYVMAFIVAVLLSSVNSGFVKNTTMLIVGVFIFHLFFKKYYNTKFKESLKIYVSYSAIVVVITLVVIAPIRLFIVQPFYVAGDAMNPTLKNLDYTFVKIYDKNYHRGDIIIHKDVKGGNLFFLKRIVGLPGEKIQIKNNEVYLISDGQETKVSETYLPEGIITIALSEDVVSLGENEYYVLGDNRSVSKDSRIYGPVDKKLFIGKYWFTAWPL